MKNIFILLFVIAPLFCISQASPVDMIIHSEQVDDHSYILIMNMAIKDGWHVYAKADTSLGIDPLNIMLGNNNLDLSDERDFKTSNIIDSLFGNKLFSIYKNKNVFQKIIKVPEQSKFIIVSMSGFASNQREVVGINICLPVNLENSIIP